jgi:hypothetical protein
MDSMR